MHINMFLFIQIKFKKAFVNDINKLSIFWYISFCVLVFFFFLYFTILQFSFMVFRFSFLFSARELSNNLFLFVLWSEDGNSVEIFWFLFFIFCGRGWSAWAVERRRLNAATAQPTTFAVAAGVAVAAAVAAASLPHCWQSIAAGERISWAFA